MVREQDRYEELPPKSAVFIDGELVTAHFGDDTHITHHEMRKSVLPFIAKVCLLL
jgi:hypothetical protein